MSMSLVKEPSHIGDQTHYHQQVEHLDIIEKKDCFYLPKVSGFRNWGINDSSFDPVSSFWIWFRILHTWKLSFLQIDHSIVESFGEGGKACITARVYPKLAINNAAHLYVFNNGSEAVKIATLNAWSMKTAKVNWNTSKICRGWRSENGNWWQFDELLLQ